MTGWHGHITLAMLPLAFLMACAITPPPVGCQKSARSCDLRR